MPALVGRFLDRHGRVLLHQAIQRGLLGTVALVVQRHAVGRARGGVIASWTVMAGAVHARPAGSGPRTVSAPAPNRHRPQDRIPFGLQRRA